jgi:hypothetical protein
LEKAAGECAVMTTERVDWCSGVPALFVWANDGTRRTAIIPLSLGLQVARALIPLALDMAFEERARWFLRPPGLGSKPRKPAKA